MRFILLFIFFSLSHYVAGQSITVYTDSVISRLNSHPIGMNLNYLMDDDTYLNPNIGLEYSLDSMKVHLLRYPGGEKSDSYMFTDSPWSSIRPRLNRTGPQEWPAGDSRFIMNDYATPKASTLDFDEFMKMAISLRAEPLIVVPYDAMYKAATTGGTIPNKRQLIKNAEEWVRYANITKKYGIKYWTIGNESYNNGSYNGYVTGTQYRDDVFEFANKMKAVDPNIKIVINGDNYNWWNTVLAKNASLVDYLAISNYPVWQYKNGYSTYLTTTPDLTDVIKQAVNNIALLPNAADRNRIRIIVSEYNAIDWSTQWKDANDVGHALVNFQMMGDQLNNPKVASSCFWNTRWVNNASSTQLYDAVNKNGNLSASGKSLAIWGRYIGDRMQASTSTTKIRSFASYDSVKNVQYVYILNKDTVSTYLTVQIKNYPVNKVVTVYEYRGTGIKDENPSFKKKTFFNISRESAYLLLPAASVTVLEIIPSSVKANISGPVTFCKTDTGNYVAKSINNTYKWRVVGGKIISKIDSISVKVVWDNTPKHSITLVESNGYGLIDSSTVNIYVKAPNTVVINGASKACTLTANTYIRTLMPTTGQLEWHIVGGQITSPISRDTIQVVWQKSGGLTSVSIDSFNCIDSTTISVALVQIAQAKIVGPQRITIGQTAWFKTTAKSVFQVEWFGKDIELLKQTPDSVLIRFSKQGISILYIRQLDASISCQKVDSLLIDVIPTSVSAFVINDVCVGGEVIILNATTNASSYIWTFGNGLQSIDKTPKGLTYAKAGNYMVRLIVRNELGVGDTTEKVITVYSQPTAKWRANAVNGRNFRFIALDSNITSAGWFINNTSKLGDTVNHLFLVDGLYLVQLVVTSKGGCKITFDSSITVMGTRILVTPQASNEFQVFPNPSFGLINIKAIQSNKEPYQVYIISSIGARTRLGSFNTQTTNSQSFDIQALPAGMYVVEIIGQHLNYHIKLQKM
ncbi:MAG: PKD domain-containing protein [Bacteroidota bacterium]|nr:PKD domain-containing protein [Bacteroidota bacterium]